MRTIVSPRYSDSHPFAVVSSDGEFLRVNCCEARAHEDRRFHLDAEVVQLRPVPTKGAHGGWRLSGKSRGPCRCVGQMSVEDWPVD